MSNNLVSNFAERLKECLENEASISATTLADNIGLSKQAISMYLSGSRNPKRPTIKAIAEALNVNEAWLMGYDVPMRKTLSTEPTNLEETLVAQNEAERRLLVMCRKVENSTPEEKEELANLFESTFDLYLKAKGLK